MANTFRDVVTRTPLQKDGSYNWDWQVSGYFFFKLIKPPTILSGADLESSLTAICTGMTLPDITIETQERIGLGGTRVTVPTSLTPTTTFDIKFVDVQPTSQSDVPLIYSFAKWANSIRNFFTGTADPVNGVSMSTYKGQAIMIGTDPSVTNITLAIRLMGIMPTGVPLSNYSADVATNDLVEYTIPFTVDRALPVDFTNPDVSALLSYAQGSVSKYSTEIPATLG